jgi:hypothetical protein
MAGIVASGRRQLPGWLADGMKFGAGRKELARVSRSFEQEFARNKPICATFVTKLASLPGMIGMKGRKKLTKRANA